VEIACRLFDAEKLPLWPAAQLAGMTRTQFEDELHKRGIAIYRPTLEDLENDIKTLKDLGY
jgi:predicted HTH domain antitoxin